MSDNPEAEYKPYNGKSTPGRKRSFTQREMDLADLSRLYLRANMNITQMTAWINNNRPYHLSYATIENDLIAIRKRWQKEYLKNTDELKRRELARIDALEAAYWEGWVKSQQNKTREISEIIEDSSGRQVVRGVNVPLHTRKKGKKMVDTRDGDTRFLEGIQWCIDERCKILGLHAPQTLQIKDWRKEAERVGISPGDIFNELVQKFVEAPADDQLARPGDAQTDLRGSLPGGVGGSPEDQSGQ